MSNADKLAEALEKILSEFVPINQNDTALKASQALASYRASKDVADDELLYNFETVKEAANDYISTLNHPNDETQKSIISEAIQSAVKAITRLQAAPNPWVKIEDPIVETWRQNEDTVHLSISYYCSALEKQCSNVLWGCSYELESCEWYDSDGEMIDRFGGLKIAHAMLAPTPPL